MKNKVRTGVIRQNASFMRMLLLYMSLLLLIAGIACVFSYQQKTEELDSQISLILTGLAGYRTSTLRKVCAGYAFLLDSMQYDLVSSGQVVFSSGEENVSRLTLQEVYHGIIQAKDGSRYYARSQTCGDNDTFLIYSARVSEIVLYTTQHLLLIPLKEELTTTRRYLRLLEARYKNQVNIRFDFPRGVLCYGIIRNVFQPLIENYFQYGFDTSNEDNKIIISGRLLDETTMLLSVSDNGCGMTEYAIEALRWKLEQPVKNSRESYGLRNLHQRLKLFYGDDCGLRIERNGERGLRVNIIARKMTCEEYEATRQKDQYTE